MYIEYDESELLELFLCEPDSLTGDMDDGEISYTKKSRNGFELTVFIHTYELECGIYLTYNEKDVFSVVLKDISKIIKKDNLMCVESETEEIATIFFGEDFNIRIN